jgi:hypothetical protein
MERCLFLYISGRTLKCQVKGGGRIIGVRIVSGRIEKLGSAYDSPGKEAIGEIL